MARKPQNRAGSRRTTGKGTARVGASAAKEGAVAAGKQPDKGTGEPYLIPQPHGGAILSRPPAGVGGAGPGRPPSVIRQALRESFAERIPLLQSIADGVVPVRLIETCEHCGRKPSKPLTTEEIIEAVPGATDRLKAIDLMGKYGMGTVKGVPDETVRERLAATIALIQRTLEPEAAESLLSEMEAIWR